MLHLPRYEKSFSTQSNNYEKWTEKTEPRSAEKDEIGGGGGGGKEKSSFKITQ